MKYLIAIFMVSMATMTIGANDAQAKKKNWKVSGKVTIKPCHMTDLRSAYGSKIPLVGAEVQLQARKKGTLIWGTWGKRTLPGSGRFSFTERKNTKDREFRVRLKYNHEKLVLVKGWAGLLPGWHEIYRSGFKRSGFHRDIRLTASGQGGCASEVMRRGEIWVGAMKMINYFKNQDRPFTGKVKIRYPANNPAVPDNVEAPFANPIDQWITIIKNSRRDWLNIATLWHEMAHIWAYQHSRGEVRLAAELLKDHSTHDFQEKPFVAFHEGFAKYIEETMATVLLGKARTLPFSKNGLRNISSGLTSATKVQGNDYGWASIFHMLTMDNIIRYNFNTSSTWVKPLNPIPAVSCPGSRKLSFKALLGAFKPRKSKGYKKNIHTREMTFNGFYTRASKIYSSLNRNDEIKFRKLISTQNSKQPYQLFCTPLTAANLGIQN
ncbi:MAG: hypothetical protein VX589_00055 [Myxococcota bacterium]|nr:hypothetical protein [Myxococcota bacterium]